MNLPSTSASTTYRHARVEGVRIFYREAGPKGAPTIVLLHGYPSSSRMFESLIPLLATQYHLIAPDYPGFGQSEWPAPGQYRYTFDRLAATMDALLQQLHIMNYVLYLQDYGGPIGFRLAIAKPQRVLALVIQNANTYQDGLGAKWAGIAQYWRNPAAHPEQLDAFVSFEGTRYRHIGNSPDPERYNPGIWMEEYAFLSRPGQREIQGQLLFDYRTNIASYPAWQQWLRHRQPPTLVIWGRYDSSFTAAGAEAYKRDVPDAEVHLLDAGHFALDEKVDEIAALMLAFLENARCRLSRSECSPTA